MWFWLMYIKLIAIRLFFHVLIKLFISHFGLILSLALILLGAIIWSFDRGKYCTFHLSIGKPQCILLRRFFLALNYHPSKSCFWFHFSIAARFCGLSVCFNLKENLIHYVNLWQKSVYWTGYSCIHEGWTQKG